MTLELRIVQLVTKHGSLRAVSKVTGIDAGYLSRLASGEKIKPGAKILRKLKLRQVITYEATA